MLRPAWGEFHPEPGICRLGKEKEKFTSIGGGSMLLPVREAVELEVFQPLANHHTVCQYCEWTRWQFQQVPVTAVTFQTSIA